MLRSLFRHIPGVIPLTLIGAIACSLVLATPHAYADSTVVFVVPGGAGVKDGSNWSNAKDLQPALVAATTGQQLWIAKGTYSPGATQTDTFQLKNAVALYGGFVGSEVIRTQRDYTTNVTTLNGATTNYHVVTASGTDATAILDGVTVTGGNARGAGNLAYQHGGGMYNVTSEATIANVSFTENGAGDGGAMYNTGKLPNLKNVSFVRNTATRGAGIYNDSSNASFGTNSFVNLSFSNNRAGAGGGIYNANSSPRSVNIVFANNVASSTGGGAVYNFASNPTIINASFSGNIATTGGGIYNSLDSRPSLLNSILYGDSGGELIGGSPTVQNSDVQGGFVGTGNMDIDPQFVAGSDLHLKPTSPVVDRGDNFLLGYGVFTDRDGNPRIINDTVDMGAYEAQACPTGTHIVRYVRADAVGYNNGESWHNAYTDLQGALERARTCAAITQLWVAKGVYSPGPGQTDTFQLRNGLAIYGGFAGNETIIGQRAPAINVTTLDGAKTNFHVVTGTGTDATSILDGLTITGGKASGIFPNDSGGGVVNTSNSSPTLTNIVFSANVARQGGGIYNGFASNPTLTNVTFIQNTATYGAGVANNKSNPVFLNVAFATNAAKQDGGGMYNSNGSKPTLINASFSGNSATNGGGIYNSLDSSPWLRNSILYGDSGGELVGGTPNVKYSDVQDRSIGATNVDVDPWFVTPGSDLHLKEKSPVMDRGDNASLPLGLVTDRDGNTRVVNGTVDLGAYERQDCPTGTNVVRYVKANATGFNNGESWSTAYTDLMSGLKRAGACANITQLWVAKGVYKPGTNQADTFQLRNGLALYGGFVGSETVWGQRDLEANVTTLDGANTNYHVVTGSGTDGSAIVDGFSITGGHATTSQPASSNKHGAGMYNLFGNPTIRNVTFHGNSASVDGGGMYNDHSNPTLINSSFTMNKAAHGAGLTNSDSNPTLTNVLFSNNKAEGNGGGMSNIRSNPTLLNVVFSSNAASGGFGGGIYNRGSDPTLTNSSFTGNSAVRGSGIFNDNSKPTIINSSFSGNTARGSGGAIANISSNPKVRNSILFGDTGGEITGSAADVQYSDIQGGYSGSANLDIDPQFIAPGGDLHLKATSLVINRGDNSALPAGVITDQDGKPRTVGGIVDLGAFERQVRIVTPSLLPDATAGRPYAVALQAESDPPATWSLGSGALPSGIVLYADGTLRGIPSQTGSFTNIAIMAANANGNDVRTFSLNVIAVPTPTSSATPTLSTTPTPFPTPTTTDLPIATTTTTTPTDIDATPTAADTGTSATSTTDAATALPTQTASPSATLTPSFTPTERPTDLPDTTPTPTVAAIPTATRPAESRQSYVVYLPISTRP
ncbi:MAG: hypothetical protein NVSMB42_06510 [Herpetosiphon sp.]